jgi:hypothetical protein
VARVVSNNSAPAKQSRYESMVVESALSVDVDALYMVKRKDVAPELRLDFSTTKRSAA